MRKFILEVQETDDGINVGGSQDPDCPEHEGPPTAYDIFCQELAVLCNSVQRTLLFGAAYARHLDSEDQE